MPHLVLALLGPLQVTVDGRPATGFSSAKVRALLAYLAVEADQPHPRDSLTALLWPDWPDGHARNNLRQALANLRAVLGDASASCPYLLISREMVQFNRASDHTLDVAAFERGIRARAAGEEREEEAIDAWPGAWGCTEVPFWRVSRCPTAPPWSNG
jgi:DNA-binding SARP family transcriptional activator